MRALLALTYLTDMRLKQVAMFNCFFNSNCHVQLGINRLRNANNNQPTN